ncbi:unnamed protein product [Effrenium voratum]|nr:unnamed protein product [Effrenium voratum]
MRRLALVLAVAFATVAGDEVQNLRGETKSATKNEESPAEVGAVVEEPKEPKGNKDQPKTPGVVEKEGSKGDVGDPGDPAADDGAQGAPADAADADPVGLLCIPVNKAEVHPGPSQGMQRRTVDIEAGGSGAPAALARCPVHPAGDAVDRRRSECTLHGMVFAQGAAIGALEKTSQWPGALALLSEAETATGLNAVLCGAALGACAKGKAWRQALLVLETMSFNALEVGVVACSVAMRCCEQEGEWQQALEVLRAMLGNAVLPDVIAYGTAMGACRHGGHWRGAFALLQDTSARRLGNEVVYSSAVSCCEAAGRADLAELLLRRMRHEKIRPNEITFNAAISACEKGRSWELALGFFEMLQQDGLQPDVVSINAGTSACRRPWVCSRRPRGYKSSWTPSATMQPPAPARRACSG